MTFNAATIDPVTTEVVASRLRETAATMEYALYHSGYSPILRESKDGTAGLTDPEGRVVIISGGLQYHFTAYQQAVQAVLARYPAAGLKPGESFVSNDPYKCGSPHAPDFVAVTPAFHQGVLLGFGWAATTVYALVAIPAVISALALATLGRVRRREAIARLVIAR